MEPIAKKDRLTLGDLNISSSVTAPAPVCLRRERPPGPLLPSFDPPQHPHCRPIDDPSHPSTVIQRTLLLANDNSSLTRQSRCHTDRPDPVPGQCSLWCCSLETTVPILSRIPYRNIQSIMFVNCPISKLNLVQDYIGYNIKVAGFVIISSFIKVTAYSATTRQPKRRHSVLISLNNVSVFISVCQSRVLIFRLIFYSAVRHIASTLRSLFRG